MEAYIAKCALGTFAYDGTGKLIDYEPFPKDAVKVANILKLSEEEGQLSEEEKRLIGRLRDCEIIIERERSVGGSKAESPNPSGKTLRGDMSNIATKLGFSIEEYRTFSREVGFLLSKIKLQEISKEKDRIIIQSIEALDDVDEALNLLSERIREWYSLHFPELDSAVEDHEKYVNMVSKLASRDAFVGEKFEDLARASLGADLDDASITILKTFAKNISDLYNFRKSLEKYIEGEMASIAPNISGLVGSPLGARLISLAGKLRNLARMPGSRIQVLGAEVAMFRHLKKKGRSPKHGVIFQFPLISTAPWWQRGKIARSLASKIAIAVRIDAYSNKNIAEKLKEDFLKRLEEIRAKYPEEPKKMRIIPYRPEERKKGGKKGKKKKGRRR